MKKLFFLFCVFSHLVSCSQINKTIVKAQAFFTVPVPGTIPVDEQGKAIHLKRDTFYTVITEVQGKAPQWLMAWIGGRSFSVLATPVGQHQVVAGKRFSDEAPILIKSGNKNSLWELQLLPTDTKKKPVQNLKKGELLLVGTLSGKPVYYKIAILTELASPAYQ